MLLGHSNVQAALCGILTLFWLWKWFGHFWAVPKDRHPGKPHSATEVVWSTRQLLLGAAAVCTNIGLINAEPTLTACRIPSGPLHQQGLRWFVTENLIQCTDL